MSAKKVDCGVKMENYLILKGASASRPYGQWKDDDCDVRAQGEAVGRSQGKPNRE